MTDIDLFPTFEKFSETNEGLLSYKYGSKKSSNFEVSEKEGYVAIKTFNRTLQKDMVVIITKDDMLSELIKQLQIIEKNIKYYERSTKRFL